MYKGTTGITGRPSPVIRFVRNTDLPIRTYLLDEIIYISRPICAYDSSFPFVLSFNFHNIPDSALTRYTATPALLIVGVHVMRRYTNMLMPIVYLE